MYLNDNDRKVYATVANAGIGGVLRSLMTPLEVRSANKLVKLGFMVRGTARGRGSRGCGRRAMYYVDSMQRDIPLPDNDTVVFPPVKVRIIPDPDQPSPHDGKIGSVFAYRKGFHFVRVEGVKSYQLYPPSRLDSKVNP